MQFPYEYQGIWCGWASSNWSGYAVTTSSTSSTYTSVSGDWTVPELASSRKSASSATWVGIDGFQSNNTSLIQTGTEDDSSRAGQSDSVWWTTSGKGFAEQPFTDLSCSPSCSYFPIAAGDEVTARITEGSPDWSIELRYTNVSATKTETATASVPYDGPADSAEWIVENPGLSPNGVQSHQGRLADFGTIVFTNAAVSVPGATSGSPNLVAGSESSDAGLLVVHNHVAATPSGPTGSGDGFSVAYGPQPPP